MTRRSTKNTFACLVAILAVLLLSSPTDASYITINGGNASINFRSLATNNPTVFEITSNSIGTMGSGSTNSGSGSTNSGSNPTSEFGHDDGVDISDCMGSIYIETDDDYSLQFRLIGMPLYADVDSRIGFGRLVDLTGCDIEISFSDGFTPNAPDSFELFYPMGNVDLAALLASTESITTPDGWALDHDTGIMAVPEPSTLLLAAMAAVTLAVFYRRQG